MPSPCSAPLMWMFIFLILSATLYFDLLAYLCFQGRLLEAHTRNALHHVSQ